MKTTTKKTDNGQTWLICGGRDFNDKRLFTRAMRFIVNRFGKPKLVVQGGARGADKLAKDWYTAKGIAGKQEDADWDKYGKAAGAIRNRLMVSKYNPDFVIAFPGGAGTADMVDVARKEELAVMELSFENLYNMEWMK